MDGEIIINNPLFAQQEATLLRRTVAKSVCERRNHSVLRVEKQQYCYDYY